MRLSLDIPDDIADHLAQNPSSGRISLRKEFDLLDVDARYYSKLWKNKLSDSSARSLGEAEILRGQALNSLNTIKDLQKRVATDNLLLDAIAGIVPSFPIISKFPVIKAKQGKIEDRDAISIWSDIHAGEHVVREQMEGMGQYDLSIMAGRLWNLIDGNIRVIDTLRGSYGINTLYLDWLGDFVGGNIHNELRETNDLPLLKTVMLLSHLLAQAVIMLVPYFKKIQITCVPGNHGRMSKKPEFKNRVSNNYDTLTYHITSLFLREYIESGHVVFNIPESPECISVRKDWAFLLGHSDNITAWAGFPVYGFFRDNAKQQNLRKLRSVFSINNFNHTEKITDAETNMAETRRISGYDYRLAGHWHTPMVMDNWTTIINGSLIGGNEFSLQKLHAVSQPCQVLAFVSKRWGLKSVEPISVIDKGHGFKMFKEGVLGEMAQTMYSVKGSAQMIDFTIVIDTREQVPYTFDAIEPKPQTVIRGLKTGDYSLDGFENNITIERKSLSDLYGSIGSGRKRFEREIARMVDIDFAAVIVEADWKTIIQNPPVRSKLNPKSVHSTICAWMQRYRVHWITCPNRLFAEKTTYKLLDRWYRDEETGLHRPAVLKAPPDYSAVDEAW